MRLYGAKELQNSRHFKSWLDSDPEQDPRVKMASKTSDDFCVASRTPRGDLKTISSLGSSVRIMVSQRVASGKRPCW